MTGQKVETMQTGCRPVYHYLRVYFVIVLLLLMPVGAFAGIQLDFEWDPNPEPDIAGYRFFSREAGEDYDYTTPIWKGQENYCSIYVDNEDGVYLFVVRAVDENGYESDDSNEVVYSGDSRYLSSYESSSGGGSGGGCFIGTLK